MVLFKQKFSVWFVSFFLSRHMLVLLIPFHTQLSYALVVWLLQCIKHVSIYCMVLILENCFKWI